MHNTDKEMVNLSTPYVSVVIPTRNRKELLLSTIKSLFKQSYPKDRYEIIIVDNSSTDGTDVMIQSIKRESQCILKYYRKENKGPGVSRNLGISKANGDIIAFTDSDCVADENWLKSGVAEMSEGVGLVQGRTIPNPDQSKRTFQHTQDIRRESGFYETCNMFYRKEILDLVGGFSQDFCGLGLFGVPRWGGEDADLGWRVKKQGWKSVFADEAVVYHHVFHVNPLKVLFSFYYISAIVSLPRTIKKHTELRDIFLYQKIFKSKRRALFYIFMLSFFFGLLVHWGFFLLAFPYVIKILKVSFSRRTIWTYHRGFALLFIFVITELIHTVLSICASLKYRTIVL